MGKVGKVFLGTEVSRWERWGNSEVVWPVRWEGSNVASWERWKGN